jgi:hypothetical protein
MSFAQAIFALRRWFEEHDLDPNAITLTITVPDPKEGWKLDFALRKEISNSMMDDPFVVIGELDNLEVLDIKIKIESPIK